MPTRKKVKKLHNVFSAASGCSMSGSGSNLRVEINSRFDL